MAFFLVLLFTGITNKSNFSNFDITIDGSAENSIRLTGEKGCAWGKLEINCADNECKYIIAEYGTYSPEFNRQSEKLDPFIIEIHRKNNSYSFSCTEGCAWSELSAKYADTENIKINLTQYGLEMK